MFGQLAAIARNTFVESLRQPVFFILVMAGGGLQIVNTLLSAFTMGFTEETEVSGDDKLLFDMGLATIMVCATLLASFIATSVLSREIENKTALTVISKPVGRPAFVLGKYLGVAAAILVATVILVVFFMFAIRHRVMSTARDTIDGPVVFFSSLAVLLSIGLAIWGNYFYGWVFPSTAIGAMLPLVLLAYAGTLFVSKQWAFQPITTDLKPQIMIAAGVAVIAVMVLTAVAVAASTRLGQVMTIVVCAGVFMLGLLSNHLLGRHAFRNAHIAIVDAVENPDELTLARAGDTLTIRLKAVPKVELAPGASLYYAPDPSGLAMAVPSHAPFAGDPGEARDVRGPDARPALVLAAPPDGVSLTLLNTGNLNVERPPRPGDFVFTQPTQSNWAARAAWSIVPNMQSFWLVDAVTQGHPIPPRYVALVAGYGVVQIAGFLALAVLMFQRRDVG
ncbi:MAG: ABC transporter permease [Planctomycetota bacterium]|nr:ABC transporter permease [Planctomycetota bacterium]